MRTPAPRQPSVLTLLLTVVLSLVLSSCDQASGTHHPRASDGPRGPGRLEGRNAPSGHAPRDGRAAVTDWPNSSNTGARGRLVRMAGRTVTTPGTTIENAQVDGQITVRADNVTIRNVRIETSGWYGILNYGKKLLVEDATIVGKGAQAGLASFPPGTVVARRLDVSKSEDGVHLSDDSTLSDSFIHDLDGTASAHFDGVTADGHTGWKIIHNTILNDHAWTAAVWVGDPRRGASSGLLADNLLAGGGYTIYGGPSVGTGIEVVDNVFSTNFFAKSGYWGPVAYWSRSGSTWSGNAWADGPRRGEAVAP